MFANMLENQTKNTNIAKVRMFILLQDTDCDEQDAGRSAATSPDLSG